MPVWARFLAATTAGAAAALAAAIAGAWWRYGHPEFWPELVRFLATAGMWWLAGRLWALMAVALGLSRTLAGLAGGGRRGGPGAAAAALWGLASGGAAATAYGTYLGARLGLQLPAAALETALLAAGIGVAGAVAGWLFQRL